MNSIQHYVTPRMRRRDAGFNMIELMIVVVIIGVLARIALPIYQGYVASGQVTEATNTTSSMRAKMEQFYQDNRTYVANSTLSSPCTTSVLTTTNNGLKYFSMSCSNLAATTYKITATGTGTLVNGFSYSIDQSNTQSSTAWGTTCSSTWKTSKSGGC